MSIKFNLIIFFYLFNVYQCYIYLKYNIKLLECDYPCAKCTSNSLNCVTCVGDMSTNKRKAAPDC